jgi:hypothetical protein
VALGVDPDCVSAVDDVLFIREHALQQVADEERLLELRNMETHREKQMEDVPPPPPLSPSAMAARGELIEIVNDLYGDHALAEKDVDEWLSVALRDSTFDATDIVLPDLPPAGWTALHRFAQEQGHGGIREVKFDDSTYFGQAMLDGLRALPELRRIELQLSYGGEIDFGRLRDDCPRLQRIDVVSQLLRRPLELIVPSGVEAVAHVTTPGIGKSRVRYLDGQGHLSAPRPLQGLLQIHRPRVSDFQNANPQLQDAHPLELELFARTLNLNGEATTVRADPSSEEALSIVCRHLAMQWLELRQAHQQAKQSSKAADSPSSHSRLADASGKPVTVPDHFAYDSFATVDGIRALTPPDAQARFKKMLDQGAQVLFEPDLFGQLVADQICRLKPGECRHFALGTPNHMLSLELRVKERWHGDELLREYVVNLYDPNATATHQRLVVGDVSRLAEMTLADWIEPERVTKYFDDGEPLLGELFQWPPEAHPITPATYVSSANRATGEYLQKAMALGQTAHVHQALDAILGQAQALEPERLREELRGHGQGMSALEAALCRNRSAVTAAFVGRITAIPDDVLDRDDKARILGADDATAMEAIATGRGEFLAAYTQAVIETADEAHLHMVLLDQALTLVQFVPELPRSPEDLVIYRGIRDFARLVAGSQLPLWKKVQICTPKILEEFSRPVTDLAIRLGNPVPAAAILIGILESQAQKYEKSVLLDESRVDVDMVVEGLRRQGDPLGWAQELTRLRDEFVQAA